MVEMSQGMSQGLELKNYLNEVQLKHRPDFLLEDVVTGPCAGELFEKAKPIDCLKEFYNGGYKPKPCKPELEHYNPEAEKKKEPLEFKLPKLRPAPSSPKCLLDSYSFGDCNASFEERVAKYNSTYGKELANYLRSQGRKLSRLERIGTTRTRQGNPALVVKVGNRAALLGSHRFSEEVEDFARTYGVSNHVAERYIFDHEYTHLSQSCGCIDSITAELDVERTLKNFYITKARESPTYSKEYLTLAKIPAIRETQVVSIYSKAA